MSHLRRYNQTRAFSKDDGVKDEGETSLAKIAQSGDYYQQVDSETGIAVRDDTTAAVIDLSEVKSLNELTRDE